MPLLLRLFYTTARRLPQAAMGRRPCRLTAATPSDIDPTLGPMMRVEVPDQTKPTSISTRRYADAMDTRCFLRR